MDPIIASMAAQQRAPLPIPVIRLYEEQQQKEDSHSSNVRSKQKTLKYDTKLNKYLSCVKASSFTMYLNRVLAQIQREFSSRYTRTFA